ncbi:hypothetical protein DFJ74DRAFT_764327 [Hyaloraphidium curvatum]|nr:hypothetical protein DFJ74DRAFT_764327 [Hyaloraphidium curvatum]
MATFGREPLPPAFPCPICLNECYPWRNPVLLETDEKACEHHLCGEPYCWEELKSGRKSGRSSASDALQNLKDDPAPTPRDTRVLCPSCKGNVVGAIKFEEWSAFGKRQYLNFKVQCPRWKSCGWEGAMSEVEAHLSKCQAFRCEHCQAQIVRGAAYGSEVDFGDLYASIELGRWGGLPAGFSVAFRDLVGRMLEVDQRGRVTTAEALAHLWFWLVWESRGGGRHQGPTGAGAWVTFDEGTGELRCVAA